MYANVCMTPLSASPIPEPIYEVIYCVSVFKIVVQPWCILDRSLILPQDGKESCFTYSERGV